jgi:predicted nucleic acid-binding protein
MIYADTSLIVAALSHEAMTPKAQNWLMNQELGGILISDWTVTEFSSAMSIKLRTGGITLEQRAKALSALHIILAESFTLLPVTSEHFRTAARFADQHELGLRGADALHLAVASGAGATVNTLDQRMAEAGPHRLHDQTMVA